MKVLIIEDEPLAAEKLTSLILELHSDFQICGTIRSVLEAVRWLQTNTADLIFLDIQLSDGLSFRIFEEIHVSTPIIFTTAYDQYAIRAFDVNSIDYLLKPIQKVELKQSLAKFQELRSYGSEELLAVLKHLKNEHIGYKNRFLITIGEQLKTIRTIEIAYFFARDKAVYLRTFSAKDIPIDYSLEQLETELDPSEFFRINRSCLLNIQAIEKMYSWSSSRIKLTVNPPSDDDSVTIVSVKRTAEFKEWLNH